MRPTAIVWFHCKVCECSETHPRELVVMSRDLAPLSLVDATPPDGWHEHDGDPVHDACDRRPRPSTARETLQMPPGPAMMTAPGPCPRCSYAERRYSILRGHELMGCERCALREVEPARCSDPMCVLDVHTLEQCEHLSKSGQRFGGRE